MNFIEKSITNYANNAETQANGIIDGLNSDTEGKFFKSQVGELKKYNQNNQMMPKPNNFGGNHRRHTKSKRHRKTRRHRKSRRHRK